jgi:hypothetical protein
VDIRKERETHDDAPADVFVSKSLAHHEAVVWMERRPTGCVLAAPPLIDRTEIVAHTAAENRPDLADAQRRRLHTRVRRLPLPGAMKPETVLAIRAAYLHLLQCVR